MPRSGVFINLERSAARRQAMQAQLQAMGLAWVRRLPAVDGAALALPPGCRLTPAESGCFLSHLQAIEAAPADHLGLVLEDDVELSPDLPAILDGLPVAALSQYDLLLLDCQPDCASPTVAALWRSLQRQLLDPAAMLAGQAPRRIRGVDLADAAPVFRWGTQAYLVTPRGRPRLAALLREALAQGPLLPVDLLLGEALRSGRLQGALSVPFLATPSLASHADSTIGSGTSNDTQALASAIRRLLFAGPVDGVAPFAQALLARSRAASPQEALLGRLVAEVFALQARDGALPVGRRGSGVQP